VNIFRLSFFGEEYQLVRMIKNAAMMLMQVKKICKSERFYQPDSFQFSKEDLRFKDAGFQAIYR